MRGVVLVLAVALLSGCTSGPGGRETPPEQPGAPPSPPPLAASTVPLAESFDGAESLPEGWTSDAGTWVVEENASAPSAPNVLRGQGGGGRSTLKASRAYRDFEANITFLMVQGDEGAGLSFRYAANGDYRIVRFSPREVGWHYFIVEGGQADKRNEATVAQNASLPRLGEWVTLRVRAEGPHVQAWHSDTLVIDYTDPDQPPVGAVGPFLRGGAVALFDDLEVRPLPSA